MADPVKLPKKLTTRGWKIKLYDNERLEPPHITVYCREKVWRIGLRWGEFLVPPGGRWKEIDPEVRGILEACWNDLQMAWNRKHPSNPVSDIEDEENG
jgi:hypothetical protein